MIYGQAALLGFSAITFFLLGMMVGSLTDTGRSGVLSKEPSDFAMQTCRVSGRVVFKANGREKPDVGAVVMLIPKRVTPPQPLAPGLVMPESFVALDNPTIDKIYELGGAAVRTDSEGKFNVLVDAGREFRTLVLSKRKPAAGRTLSESQQLVLAKWFAPSEKIVRDNDFRWQDVDASGEEATVGTVKFE